MQPDGPERKTEHGARRPRDVPAPLGRRRDPIAELRGAIEPFDVVQTDRADDRALDADREDEAPPAATLFGGVGDEARAVALGAGLLDPGQPTSEPFALGVDQSEQGERVGCEQGARQSSPSRRSTCSKGTGRSTLGLSIVPSGPPIWYADDQSSAFHSRRRHRHHRRRRGRRHRRRDRRRHRRNRRLLRNYMAPLVQRWPLTGGSTPCQSVKNETASTFTHRGLNDRCPELDHAELFRREKRYPLMSFWC
jgi:hypothetical protein